jgi:NAD(P)-dependent dehydrogenase (short-subunit alcohol dehydrogenase family)
MVSGKIALVTGGARGIGAAIVRRLVGDGVRTIVLDRQRTAFVSEVGATFIECDLTNGASVSRALAEARDVSILVQSAGIGESAPFTQTTDEIWDRAMALNVTAAFRVARALVPPMVASKWGRVIHVASIAGLVGQPYVTAYCASKHALIGLTRAMAAELATTGVTVNAVCPGFVDTEMTKTTIANIVAKTKRTPDEARRSLEDMNPQHRLVQPEEIANIVAMLCGEEARGINGQAIAIDGGQVTLTAKPRSK